MAGGNNISKYFSPASFLCLLKHHSLLKLPPSRKVRGKMDKEFWGLKNQNAKIG